MKQPVGLASRRALLNALLGSAAWRMPAASASALTLGSARADKRPTWPAIPLLDGTMLAPDFWSGRGAIIVFWATWCPYCHRHNQRLQALVRKLKDGGPRVLGIAIDTSAQKVLKFATQEGYTFALGLDSAVSLRSTLDISKVVPNTCVVRPNGEIRLRIPGEMTEEDLFGLVKDAT